MRHQRDVQYKEKFSEIQLARSEKYKSSEIKAKQKKQRRPILGSQISILYNQTAEEFLSIRIKTDKFSILSNFLHQIFCFQPVMALTFMNSVGF